MSAMPDSAAETKRVKAEFLECKAAICALRARALDLTELRDAHARSLEIDSIGLITHTPEYLSSLHRSIADLEHLLANVEDGIRVLAERAVKLACELALLTVLGSSLLVSQSTPL